MPESTSDISKLRPLQMIPPEDLARLEALSYRMDFRTGDVVIQQGTAADRAWLLVSGRLTVRVDTPKGPRALGDVWPGEIAGESALFEGADDHSVTITAAGPSSCLAITPELLLAARGTPALTAVQTHLMGALARRIRATNLTIRKVWQEDRAATAASRKPGASQPQPTKADAPRSLFQRLAEIFGG